MEKNKPLKMLCYDFKSYIYEYNYRCTFLLKHTLLLLTIRLSQRVHDD